MWKQFLISKKPSGCANVFPFIIDEKECNYGMGNNHLAYQGENVKISLQTNQI